MLWPLRLLSSPKTISLGLDISASAVTLVTLTYSNDQYHVHHYGQCALADEVMNGGRVASIEGLAQSLRDLIASQEALSRTDVVLEAVIAVPDACTITRTLSVSDRLDEHDLEELVQIELDKVLSHSKQDICFDFRCIGSSNAQPNLKDLWIVATRAQYVQYRVEALRQAGLRVSVVDMESLAIQRVLPLILSNASNSAVTLVVDVGVGFVKGFFFKGLVLVFMREEEFGGQRYDGDLQCSWSYEEEVFKCVKRSCQFFYSAHTFIEKITQVILSGLSAHYPNLSTYLSEELSMPTQVANPFASMRCVAELNRERLMAEAPYYVTACGLAQRAC